MQEFLRSNTIAIHVDANNRRDLVETYGVEGYPTCVFVDASGKLIGDIVGYVPPTEFLKRTAKLKGLAG